MNPKERENLIQSAQALRTEAAKLEIMAGVKNDVAEEVAGLLEHLPQKSRYSVVVSVIRRYHLQLYDISSAYLNELADKPYLTLREAGTLVSRSPEYLRKLTHQGRIAFMREPSGIILLRPTDVQTYIANIKRGNRQKAPR